MKILNTAEVALVKSTCALVHAVAGTASQLFYRRLFELQPELQPLFANDLHNQGAKFMATLAFVVEILDHPETLTATALRLGREHAKYGMLDAHYAVAGEALLWTLEQVLGPVYTPEAHAAWAKVYAALAALMQQGARQA